MFQKTWSEENRLAYEFNHKENKDDHDTTTAELDTRQVSFNTTCNGYFKHTFSLFSFCFLYYHV